MPNQAGLLAMDWDAPVSEEARDLIFEKIIAAVRRWRLELPVTLFLETTSPLGHLAGQGMIFGSPLLALMLPGGLMDVQRLSKLLQEPRNIHHLIDQIEEGEPDAARL